jgi:RNA polymerase sigma-70 factor (ECF subfamily)
MMAAPVDDPLKSDSRSDQELIAAMNDGDSNAFETLYYRYRDWVVSLAYRFTGDRELALDTLQETFLYFIKKFPGFRLTAQLKTFLYPAVRNLSIAARRKAERFRSDENDTPTIEAAITTEPTVNQEGPLTAALAVLSDDHREVLLLRFVDGLSLAEIAESLDIPLGTVKSRLHTALKTLRHDPRTKTYFEQ